MTIRFFLFDRSRRDLERGLDEAGQPLETLLERFGFEPPPVDAATAQDYPDDGHWTLASAEGEDLFGDDPARPRGAAVSLQGSAEALRAFTKALQDKGLGWLVGVEIAAPAPLRTGASWPHWSAGRGKGAIFGDRRRAHALIGADALRDLALDGRGVNVVLADQGIDRTYVTDLGGTFAGGLVWKTDGKLKIPGQVVSPYRKRPHQHSAMLLRSVLALAPGARIWDMPIIPRGIRQVDAFTARASLAYLAMTFASTVVPGPWVFLNAWGIGDRFGEGLWGSYSDNPDHPLNRMIGDIGARHDVVFAAGNSGQFRPMPGTGPYDRGPGNSILGANGLGRVTSVGAVRADAAWVGAASQGPGPAALGPGPGANEKPDLCAPSWFAEDADPGLTSTGTSAASAVVAGAMAALRQGWSPGDVTPEALRAVLRDSAGHSWTQGWNARLGAGVLNLRGVVDALPGRPA